jgi:transcription elongation factor Elf1
MSTVTESKQVVTCGECDTLHNFAKVKGVLTDKGFEFTCPACHKETSSEVTEL